MCIFKRGTSFFWMLISSSWMQGPISFCSPVSYIAIKISNTFFNIVNIIIESYFTKRTKNIFSTLFHKFISSKKKLYPFYLWKLKKILYDAFCHVKNCKKFLYNKIIVSDAVRHVAIIQCHMWQFALSPLLELTGILHDNSDQPCWNPAIHPTCSANYANKSPH